MGRLGGTVSATLLGAGGHGADAPPDGVAGDGLLLNQILGNAGQGDFGDDAEAAQGTAGGEEFRATDERPNLGRVAVRFKASEPD